MKWTVVEALGRWEGKGEKRRTKKAREREREIGENDDEGVEIRGRAVAGGRDPFSPAYCMPYAASLPH